MFSCWHIICSFHLPGGLMPSDIITSLFLHVKIDQVHWACFFSKHLVFLLVSIIPFCPHFHYVILIIILLDYKLFVFVSCIWKSSPCLFIVHIKQENLSQTHSPRIIPCRVQLTLFAWAIQTQVTWHILESTLYHYPNDRLLMSSCISVNTIVMSLNTVP